MVRCAEVGGDGAGKGDVGPSVKHRIFLSKE